ncbi:MAG: hypothetical protein Kow0029_13800 [Candidatus Rifleibacteriota bacterium]
MKRNGFAVPIVLVFATILAIIGTFVFKNTRQYGTQTKTSLAQLQAHFLARAGFQHAMLKIKLLNRELYDAAFLSQGLNPLFNFNSITDYNNPHTAIGPYNPGPIFLYKNGAFTRNGLFTKNFNPSGPNNKDLWLQRFQEDIASGFTEGSTTYNGCLKMVPPPPQINNLLTEPFSGQYQITALNVAARETDEAEAKVSNYAIIEMTMESTINNAKDQNFVYKMNKTVKVTREK